MSDPAKPLDIFIEGENVDLCIPTREFAATSDWYNWFNDPQLTRYLYHGSFPNTPDDQVDFYGNERKKRLLLIVSNKNQYVGVISLSNINRPRREADMAMVISNKKAGRMTPWISLEAIARITIHAMETMALNRINSGQHINLAGWQHRKEVLGYRLEGIARDGFVKGREVVPLLRSSIIFQDYLLLKENRNGTYWDSLDKMKSRIKRLPKPTILDGMKEFFNESEEYYKRVFQL